MVASYSVIGQPVVRGEGPDKVSGQSIYTSDVILPGMLWGKVLRSPLPHARIVSIDTSRAAQLPGVHAVITGQDIPDRRVGRLLRDCPVLARDKVLFVGEKVAAVAAEDPDIAEEALLLIDVEYEDLTPVFDPEDAMTAEAPTLHEGMESYPGLPQPPSGINNVFAHNVWGKGDIEQGFAESDLIFEHTFTTQLHHQAYLEPHACVVDIGDDGRVQIWANNKGPFMLREQLSAVWEMPQDNILVNPTSIGGDFGGKGSFMDIPLCYYLAKASGRPVKMVMDYVQELMAGNPRHPATITIKDGYEAGWPHLGAPGPLRFQQRGIRGVQASRPPAGRRPQRRSLPHTPRAHRQLHGLYQQHSLRPHARPGQAPGGLCRGVPHGHDCPRNGN